MTKDQHLILLVNYDTRNVKICRPTCIGANGVVRYNYSLLTYELPMITLRHSIHVNTYACVKVHALSLIVLHSTPKFYCYSFNKKYVVNC